ncbi:MAG: aminotransferase class V-fold PLP-dependent enzyme [Steroidobacteraceae bacterium]
MSERQRDAFDVPDHVAYLNCANLAPRLRAVNAAGQSAMERMSRPWGIQAADWFADAAKLQQLFGQLIGAPAASIALVPAVSYGIAVAARNVPVKAGRNIVVVDREYPSNFYSWQRLARERGAQIRTAAGTNLTSAILELIDKDTAVVATANCRWSDAALIDLPAVGAAARRHGAALVVDASQSLGAYPLDVAEVQPDFLMGVGYKWLLGPYGLGYMYVSERWHSQGEPLEESWLNRRDSDNFATLAEYTDEYRPGAQRFSQGESAQFYLLPMAIAALSQIVEWSPAYIQGRLSEHTELLAAGARRLGFTCRDGAGAGRAHDRIARAERPACGSRGFVGCSGYLRCSSRR